MDYETLELHKDFSVWNYDYSIGFALEIDSEKVRRFLPKGLHPFEIKPGISLLMINVLQFMEDNYNFPAAFTEVTFSVNVIPDLMLAGRLPKFAVYVINVGVDNPDFAGDAYNTDKLPFYPRALDIVVDRDAGTVSCRDDRGPIFTLKDIGGGSHFERKEDFFQVFSSLDGRILHGAMTLDAETYEHQMAGSCGRIHAHPIFCGLEAENPAAENYMQLITSREALGIQHYYRLRPDQR
jgi:hypothetical protein